MATAGRVVAAAATGARAPSTCGNITSRRCRTASGSPPRRCPGSVRRRSASTSASGRATRRALSAASRISSSTCCSAAPTPTSALEIAQIFDRFGAELNAATSREFTEIYARVIDSHLDAALNVVGGMVRHPPGADLDAEREVVLEEIAMYDDAPDDLVHDLIGEVVFPGDALGGP